MSSSESNEIIHDGSDSCDDDDVSKDVDTDNIVDNK